jgi:hypothetical protein
MDSPVGSAKLADLAEHYGPLNFLLPGQPKPVFDNDRVAVTREAAPRRALRFEMLSRICVVIRQLAAKTCRHDAAACLTDS